MAIPGYINTSQTGYTDTEYYQELSPLVGILGDSITDVISFVKGLINEIDANLSKITSDEDGVLDLTKVKTPTILAAIAKNIRVVSPGGMSQAWPLGFWGYYDGYLCAYFGDAADDAARTWATTITSQLQTPVLYYSKFENPIMWALGEEISYNFSDIQFLATFTTRWGESPPSDSLVVEVRRKPGFAPYWEITLEVEESSIPAYAKSVRYYQFKTDGFYLIQEVEI